MTNEMRSQADVIIVGGGPVGMGLAIELGQRGIPAIVVERHPQPQPVPKGQNLTQRTMEHFYFWGIETDLRAARTIPKDYGIGGLTIYGSLLSPYHYDWLQRALVRPFYFTDNERLPQYATESVLRRRASQLPSIDIRYGWDAVAISQDSEGVAVEIAEHKGDQRQTLSARYAVGCDGSHSVVREQTGITQTLSDHDRKMVLLVFRSPKLHELLKRYPDKCYYAVLHPDLEGYWMFFGRVDLGNTWFFHAPVPPETTKDNFDFKAYLHRAAGAEFDVEFEHIGFWDMRFAIADNYRSGRVFIAGDAAHSHPPYGGYGINTGFEDIRNLGWKIAARLQGWGGEALLDSYSAERRPVFASTATDFIERAIQNDRNFLETYNPERDKAAFETAWNARGSAAIGEVDAFEPNYEGSPVVHGSQGAKPSAVGGHSFRARVGHHLAPQPLSSGKNIYEELDDGFALAAFNGEPDVVDSFEAAARQLGFPLKVLHERLDGATARYEARYVLIRPDQFVAWCGDAAPGDIRALLEGVSGGKI